MTEKNIIIIGSYCTAEMAETLPIAAIAFYCKKKSAEDGRRFLPIARLSKKHCPQTRRNAILHYCTPYRGQFPVQ